MIVVLVMSTHKFSSFSSNPQLLIWSRFTLTNPYVKVGASIPSPLGSVYMVKVFSHIVGEKKLIAHFNLI